MASSGQTWKDGYWCNREAERYITIIKGEKMQMKKLACLDLPNAISLIEARITGGDFGPTPEDIAILSGMNTYNLQMEFVDFHKTTPAVLNEKGMGEIHFLYKQPVLRAWKNVGSFEAQKSPVALK